MQFKPLVSVIINNYNYDRFLFKAIESALAQTYSDVEVIVVDDCSTDNSREIIQGYGDRIIPIFHAVNGKQAAALNSGFAASQGDLIIFLDSDDYLLPHAVEQIVATWKPEVIKIHYHLTVVDTVGEPLGFSYPQGGKPLASGQVWQSLLSTGTYNSVPLSGNAFKRQALAPNFPIPDEYKLTADDYLWVLLPFYGELAAIEQPLGAYRVHTSNQWAMATVSGDRFRRFVRHDLQNYGLLVQKATELGYEIPPDLEFRSFGRLWSRMASLRLDRENHPVPSDQALRLIYLGIRSLWKYSDYDWKRRLLYSLWFLGVGLSPLPLAKMGITWLFVPHQRPKLWSRFTKKSSTSLSQERGKGNGEWGMENGE